MTTDERGPLGSECNAELGPDSERARFDAWANEHWMLIDDPGSSYQVWLAGAAAERERCAKLLTQSASLAWSEGVAAERERIKARLRGMDDAAGGRHNYYAHAALVLFEQA